MEAHAPSIARRDGTKVRDRRRDARRLGNRGGLLQLPMPRDASMRPAQPGLQWASTALWMVNVPAVSRFIMTARTRFVLPCTTTWQ
jgi:hypothetical protein